MTMPEPIGPESLVIFWERAVYFREIIEAQIPLGRVGRVGGAVDPLIELERQVDVHEPDLRVRGGRILRFFGEEERDYDTSEMVRMESVGKEGQSQGSRIDENVK